MCGLAPVTGTRERLCNTLFSNRQGKRQTIGAAGPMNRKVRPSLRPPGKRKATSWGMSLGGSQEASSSSFPSSSHQVLRWPWTSFSPPLLETLLQAPLISTHWWWPYPHGPAAGVGSPDSTNGSDIILATPNKDSFKIILFLAVKAF